MAKNVHLLQLLWRGECHGKAPWFGGLDTGLKRVCFPVVCRTFGKLGGVLDLYNKRWPITAVDLGFVKTLSRRLCSISQTSEEAPGNISSQHCLQEPTPRAPFETVKHFSFKAYRKVFSTEPVENDSYRSALKGNITPRQSNLYLVCNFIRTHIAYWYHSLPQRCQAGW